MTAKSKAIEKSSKPELSALPTRMHRPNAFSNSYNSFDIPHTIGNLATQRLFQAGLIQAKLNISKAGDAEEQEADRIAEQVVTSVPVNTVQRKCSACASGTTCPKCDEEEKIHTKAKPAQVPRVTPKLESSLTSLRGGQPLSPSLRSFFEPRFGRDFSQVRIHTNGHAAESAQSIQAKAYTYGKDIAFGANEYAPETDEGRRLLAHELTHTVQQDHAHTSVNGIDRIHNTDITTSNESRSIQRQVTPTETPLIDRYRAALSASSWAEAAVLLNGFNDADIEARVNDTTELPPPSRLQLRLHTPEWAFRVRRPLLMLDYNDAKAAGRWTDAATLLNGFNDSDIQMLASQLTAVEVGPMVHGAREAMEGPSLHRVLRGIAHRYDEVSPDPPGTKALTVVGLMQAAGMSIQAASAYLQLKLGVRVAAGSVNAGSGDGQKSAADNTADINVFATAMKSGGALAAAGGPGAPQALPPAQLEKGNLAHALIGDIYCALNPPCVFDLSITDILGFAKGRVPGLAKAIKAAKADLFTNFDMRPDIVDLGKMQLFEIKPLGSTALAVSEALLYVELFNALDIPELKFSLGNPGNRGTRGLIPGPEEVLVWASPLPGAIIYDFVRPPAIPQRVQERIQSGAYEPGLGLGPEAIIALGTGAVAVAAVAVEGLPLVAAAAVSTYETLIPILTAAARAAGQAIPRLIESTP